MTKTASLGIRSLIRIATILAVPLLFFISSSSYAQYSQRQTAQQVPNGFQTKFWAYVPADYPSGDHPLLISLHGGSAIGDDLNKLLETTHENPALLISQDKWFDLPFVVVSPQMKLDPEYSAGIDYNEQNWDPEEVDQLIDYVVANYNIDESRIYVTGISLGAAGTWRYAVAHPERVAAILPLGGKAPKGDACMVKDIPIWAFHGENDFLVPTRFATDMMEAIKDCTPAGKYIPHLNLSYTMDHPVWNQVYNNSGGYDVYQWLLSFQKGDDSNKNPFVFTGLDKRILKPASHFYLTAEYFDSDGSVAQVSWSQVSNGSPMLLLENTNSRFLKVNTGSATADANYVFRLTVTDDDGAFSSDEVTVRLLSTNDARAITALRLTGANGTPDLGFLTNDQVVDLPSDSKLNIEAIHQGTGVRVKWGVNSDQHVRNSSTPSFIKFTTGSSQNIGWTVTKPGEYLVCATAHTSVGSLLGDPYTALCYRITFRNDGGITKYYATNNSEISNLSSWKTQEDGSGSSPANFSDANQWFIINDNAVLNSSLVIGAESRLVVWASGRLTVNAALSGPFHIEGKGYVEVTGTGSISTYTKVSRTSTVVYNTNTNILLPLAEFGHLHLKGTGEKRFTNGFTYVRGHLIAESGSTIVNTNSGVPNPTGGAQIYASGNVDISSPNHSFPVYLRFIEGYGNQYLKLPGNYAFRLLSVEKSVTVDVQAPGTSTLTIGTGNQGTLEVHKFGLLKLNGHNVNLIATAALNPPSSGGVIRDGKIELTNSTITINTTTPGTEFNLYPASDKRDLKNLEVNIPSGHAGFNIMDSLDIAESVRIVNGRINTNGRLTLLSTAESTAFVDEIVSPAAIIGAVNVQRYIAPGRQYRYLSFPVKNFTVAKLQQFIPVTGAFQNASTGPGLSSSPSLFTWNEPTYSWNAYPAANQDNQMPLTDGNGYAVFVRSEDQPTTMVMSGELHIGNKTFTLNDNPQPNDTLGWTLVGNPYAAPIVWEGNEAPLTGWTVTDVDPSVHVRDNELNDFRFWDGEAGNLSGGIISTGQSFWVRSITNAATLTIQESAKEPTSTPELYRAKRSDVPALGITVKRDKMQSQAFIKFKPWGDHIFIRGRDTMKKRGDVLNVSLLSSDDRSVAIKSLCDTLCRQEIGVLIEAKKPGQYALSAAGLAFDKMIDKLTLKDAFIGSAVELKENDEYVFEITPDPKSRARNRFTLIIFKAGSDQPFISLEDGYLVSSIDTDVQWALNGADIEGANQGVLLPSGDGDYTVRTIGKKCTQTSPAFSYRVTSLPEQIHPVQVFPIPANDEIQLSGLASRGLIQYEIRSVNGAQIKTGEAGASDGGTATLDVRSLPSGLYLLVLRDSGVRIVKFAITR